jgi:hypothetical protein
VALISAEEPKPVQRVLCTVSRSIRTPRFQRRSAGESPEFASHVALVGVAGEQRDIGDR